MDLHDALDALLREAPKDQLIAAAQAISLRYRTRERGSGPFIKSRLEALAYAAARMPATYGAVYSALAEVRGEDFRTLLDVGAGTGAATWAAEALFDLSRATLVEYNGNMRAVGEALLNRTATWHALDIASDPLPVRADLVIASYVINELEKKDRARIAEVLWNATDRMLLLIEAGTPEGYKTLMEMRALLLSLGAHIAAPCPHENACPMADGDWCHFTCRVPRSRLHRIAKGGEAPYEDEKYAYIAFSRVPTETCDARILRHPQIGKGHVGLTMCTPDGIEKRTYSKRDGEKYKRARKARCGSCL